MRSAIIGGTGVYGLMDCVRAVHVSTRYGDADLDIATLDGIEIAFIARHGKQHTIAPHQINYRANIRALKNLGVDFIFATAAVGSCSERFHVGDVVVMRDFLDFTKHRICTFFEDPEPVRHVLMHEPYCRNLTNAFLDRARQNGLDVAGEAVYVCTEGPRFETAAEIRMFMNMGGEVVGMTSVPEVVLAKEVGICYASIGIVTNMCTGLLKGKEESHEIDRVMQEHKESVLRCCIDVLQSPLDKTCCTVSDTLL